MAPKLNIKQMKARQRGLALAAKVQAKLVALGFSGDAFFTTAQVNAHLSANEIAELVAVGFAKQVTGGYMARVSAPAD
jgi:hypothetical protein